MARTESQLLTIRFVSADRGAVVGNMAPYWDPDRECQALASFITKDGLMVVRGRLKGATRLG